MELLKEKTALVFGVANDHSIAWGISRAMHGQGARLAFSYAGEALERRVRPLAQSLGSTFVEPCDVCSDEQIASVMEKARTAFGRIDILVHSIGFALREELHGPFYNTSRKGFQTALEISAYSLTALTRAALPILSPGAAILTLTYYGSAKVMPNYNVMGVAKAALEASVRYLAADLGPQNIRVNAISAGPIRTLAAAGVSGFRGMHSRFREVAPLRRNVDISDVGAAAVFLCSGLAAGITGEVLYVDGGYNIMGLTEPIESPGS
ncbi:MAG: enoyl-ACP reductase [Anaerolineales bacterium]|jgi:enoyl-[acyl-carrier protein] reductase I